MASLEELSRIIFTTNESNAQEHCDMAFYAKKENSINIEQYVAILNRIQYMVPEHIKKYVLCRLDPKGPRTLGAFGRSLYEDAEMTRERFIVWVEKYAEKHFGSGPWKIEDFGVENSGRVIIDTGPDVEKPDFRITSESTGKKVIIEWKPNDKCDTKTTYKALSLKAANKYGAFVITEQKKWGTLSFYTVMSLEIAQRILDKVPEREFKFFGGKKCHQLIRGKATPDAGKMEDYLKLYYFKD